MVTIMLTGCASSGGRGGDLHVPAVAASSPKTVRFIFFFYSPSIDLLGSAHSYERPSGHVSISVAANASLQMANFTCQ